MSANVVVPTDSESSLPREVAFLEARSGTDKFQDRRPNGLPDEPMRFSFNVVEERVSSWSCSRRKRAFDLVCVLLALPLLIPICLIIGLAIRLTSRGPILFLQKRAGLHRQRFTILKFRTMEHRESGRHHSVTTTENQRFTPIGPFLRRWKLDEFPQLLNVLRGDMSLVGPRPKIPEHQIGDLHCRPGITGAATIAFAREEKILARLPNHHLEGYYHSVILPAKLRLDGEYMAQATCLSDLKLILQTALRRWDSETMLEVLNLEKLEAENRFHKVKVPSNRVTSISRDESLASAD